MRTYTVPPAGLGAEIGLSSAVALVLVLVAIGITPWLVPPLLAAAFWLLHLRPVRTVTLDADGTLSLRSVLRSGSLHATDVKAVSRGFYRLGGVYAPAALRTSRGRWPLHGGLAHGDLLAGLREHNPLVEGDG